MGFRLVLNGKTYGPLFFMIVLALPYAFKEWYKILALIVFFTAGFLLAFVLAFFDLLVLKWSVVRMLIPVSILVMALFNLFTSRKSSKKQSLTIISFVVLFFGIIYGLNYYNYFIKSIDRTIPNKFISLLEFSLGIEAGQILIVFLVMLTSVIIQNLFKFSKKDWILATSSFVIGAVLPLFIGLEYGVY